MAKKQEMNKTTFAPIPEDVSPNDIVMVRNGFNGHLIYVSSKTGEKFTWDSFGDEVEMELRELRSAKGSQKGFFEKNWFMFDEEYSWVIPYLGLTKYYEHAVPIDDMENIFQLTSSEIKKVCSQMNEWQKHSLKYMAREKYSNGEIDSLKVVKALEDGLDISLSEH